MIPPEQRIKNFYNSKYEDTELIRIRPSTNAPRRHGVMAYYGYKALGTLREGKALEIGGGAGEVANYLRWFYDEYVVTEFSDTRYEYLKLVFKSPQVMVLHNDIEREPLPFPKEYFDTIIMSSVLEHLIEPINVIKYCHHLLKKDGRLLIQTPNVVKCRRRARVFFGRHPATSENSREILDGGHLHEFTFKILKEILLDCGFRKFKILRYGHILRRILPNFFSECIVEGVK